MGYGISAALLVVVAFGLLSFYKNIELFLSNKIDNKKQQANHAHNLVMDIGQVLENERGIDQVTELKPKLEQAKKYYRNNSNNNVVPLSPEPNKNQPVKLKVV